MNNTIKDKCIEYNNILTKYKNLLLLHNEAISVFNMQYGETNKVLKKTDSIMKTISKDIITQFLSECKNDQFHVLKPDNTPLRIPIYVNIYTNNTKKQIIFYHHVKSILDQKDLIQHTFPE